MLLAGSNWVREADVLYDPKQTPFLFHDGYGEYRKYGYWLSNGFMPGCTHVRLNNKIRVRGLIATYRYYRSRDKNLTFATLGYASGRYWDVVIEGKVLLHNADLLDIEGEAKSFFGTRYIAATKIHGMKELGRDWSIPEDRHVLRACAD